MAGSAIAVSALSAIWAGGVGAINWTIQPPRMGESPMAPTISQDSAHQKLPIGGT